MVRRRTAALVLTLLFLLSGCSGLLSGGWRAPFLAESGPATYPAGYDETGVTDSEAAIAAHTEGIRSYESFTFTYRATIELPNRSKQVTYTQAVDTI